MSMLVFGKGVQSSVTVHRGAGTRRRGTSLKHFISIQRSLETSTQHPMTLRLNTEAGNTGLLKGRLN